jgi:hypothetical protein
VSTRREVASITALNSGGWRARFALCDDPVFGTCISSRVLEVIERDAGRMACHGQGVASPVAPSVFAEADASPAVAFRLLLDKARYDRYDLDPDEPVGLEELAARLGVERDTADKWRTRGVLPQPTWRVGGRPAWRWAVIVQWVRETGRQMPGCLASPLALRQHPRHAPSHLQFHPW